MFRRRRLPSDAAPLVVHASHRPPAPFLRYIDQVVDARQTEMHVRFVRGPLRRFDVDVVHVCDEHLDSLLGFSERQAIPRLASALLLVSAIRIARIALVRTVLEPAGNETASATARITRRLLDDATARYIRFDDSRTTTDQARTTVIPHAHFRDRFLGYPRAVKVEGRVLRFANAGLDPDATLFASTVRASKTPGLSTRLAGEFVGQTAANLHENCAGFPYDLSTRLEHLSDGARVQEIDAAELVAVPKIDSLHDLQDVFLALSLDRPVLVPRTESTSLLARQTGPGWVHLFDGPLAPQDIDLALASIRGAQHDARPNLDGRELDAVHEGYAAVFREAALAQHKARAFGPEGNLRLQ